MHYYLLRCTRSKCTLMQEVRKCKDHIIFQEYESDVICAQYYHLVIETWLLLKAVKSRKNSKHRQSKLLIEDHNAILDNMPLVNFCSLILGLVGGRGQMSFQLHVVGLVSRDIYIILETKRSSL